MKVLLIKTLGQTVETKVLPAHMAPLDQSVLLDLRVLLAFPVLKGPREKREKSEDPGLRVGLGHLDFLENKEFLDGQGLKGLKERKVTRV